jgi:hypothetical protein
MRLSRILAGALLALALIGLAGPPTVAAKPRQPPGCTFERGESTCVEVAEEIVTETYTERTTGPSSDGSLVGQFCLELNPVYTYYLVPNNPGDTTVARQTLTTTTTTVSHGRPGSNGKVIAQTSETTRSPVTFNGSLACSAAPF